MKHRGQDAEASVWEHNTHICDAWHTAMVAQGMVNAGHLVRKRHNPQGVALVGFGSSRGSVIAGREWEVPMERMRVPQARAGGWEGLLHRARADDQLLIMRNVVPGTGLLEPRRHRASGVACDPDRELGNCGPGVVPRSYDAFH